MRFDNNVQNSLPRCRRPRSLFFPGLVHGLSPPSRGPVGLSVRIRDPPLSPDRNSTEFRGKALTVHVTNGFAGTFKVKQPGRQEWQRCAEGRPTRPDAQGQRPPRRAQARGTQTRFQLPSGVVMWTWKGELSRSSRAPCGCVGDPVSVGTVTTLASPGFPLRVTLTGPILKCKGQLPCHPLSSLSGRRGWEGPAFGAKNPAVGDFTPRGLLRPLPSLTTAQRGRLVISRSAAEVPQSQAAAGDRAGPGASVLLESRGLQRGEGRCLARP